MPSASQATRTRSSCAYFVAAPWFFRAITGAPGRLAPLALLSERNRAVALRALAVVV